MSSETPLTESIATHEVDSLAHSTKFTENSKPRNNWLHFEKNEILILLSYLFFGAAFAIYEPYAPIWISGVNSSLLIIGFVSVIPTLIGAIGSPFWGFLADKFGSKKFVLLGFSAYALMFFSLIFNISTTYFLIMVFSGYLIGSALSTNFFVFASKSIKKPKEIIFAKLTIIVSLAYASLSPLAGWIYDIFENYMMIQLILAISLISIAFVFSLFVKEQRIEKETEIIGTQEKISVKITLFPLVFAGVMILTFFFQSGAGFWAYTSTYFLKTMEIKGIYFSIFIIIKMSLAIPISFLLGLVKKERNMGRIIMLFTAYYIIVYLVMSIFPTYWWLLIILYSIPMYPVYNVFLYALTASYSTEKRRATAFGIFNLIGTFGYIAGIITLGLFADNTSIGFLEMLWPSMVAEISDHEKLHVLIMFIPSLVIATLSTITSFILYLFKFRKNNTKIARLETE
ncbi:MAG: MFS transporter [Candidatus Thorarchaeota archaeon]